MSLSSFCVCMNALRLNLVDIYDAGHDVPLKKAAKERKIVAAEDSRQKEGEKMTKRMTIEGMMCAHCEATVKKALEAREGVSQADVSHEQGTAVVTLTQDVLLIPLQLFFRNFDAIFSAPVQRPAGGSVFRFTAPH